jgi:hypothetical protein
VAIFVGRRIVKQPAWFYVEIRIGESADSVFGTSGSFSSKARQICDRISHPPQMMTAMYTPPQINQT